MRPITDVIGDLGAGQTQDTLTANLAEIVAAVQATGNAGKLTLELTVKPNGAQVVIADKITTKVPQENRGDTIFFADEDGGLHRRDPRQHEMPLRQVGEHDD